MGYICSHVDILTNYYAYGVWWLRIAQSKGCTRLGASLPENGNRACVFKELDHGQNPSPPKKKSVNFSHVLLCLLGFLTFEDGGQ
jgi:hypothetical protein